MTPLSQAIPGFLFAKEVQGLSPNTSRNYTLILKRFLLFFRGEDPPLTDISALQIRAFLHSLQKEAPPTNRVIRQAEKPLSPKSIRNTHAALSSMWEWAIEEGLADENVVRKVKPPNPKLPAVKPFEPEEIQEVLKHTIDAPSQELRLRDKAMILFLLDTGVRVSELSGLKVKHVDLIAGSALVSGKGRLDSGAGRQRLVYFGDRVRRAVHRYLQARKKVHGEAWLFATEDGRQLTRMVIRKHLSRIGERAGVLPCYPHRFRHTFAIFYLRNGGDVFTLQRLLGHSSLDMVKRYLSIAQTDVEAAHRKAGPVDNWGL